MATVPAASASAGSDADARSVVTQREAGTAEELDGLVGAAAAEVDRALAVAPVEGLHHVASVPFGRTHVAITRSSSAGWIGLGR